MINYTKYTISLMSLVIVGIIFVLLLPHPVTATDFQMYPLDTNETNATTSQHNETTIIADTSGLLQGDCAFSKIKYLSIICSLTLLLKNQTEFTMSIIMFLLLAGIIYLLYKTRY